MPVGKTGVLESPKKVKLLPAKKVFFVKVVVERSSLCIVDSLLQNYVVEKECPPIGEVKFC